MQIFNDNVRVYYLIHVINASTHYRKQKKNSLRKEKEEQQQQQQEEEEEEESESEEENIDRKILGNKSNAFISIKEMCLLK